MPLFLMMPLLLMLGLYGGSLFCSGVMREQRPRTKKPLVGGGELLRCAEPYNALKALRSNGIFLD
jgi:hypothetical protein